jgi:hypothetical protein
MSESSDLKHELRRPLYEVLSINGVNDPEKIVDLILSELGDYGLIDYGPRTPKLLSTAGRIVMTIALRPDVTMSQIGMIVGINSATVAQNISALVKGNVITRTKLGRKNCYQINEEALANHPDIIKLKSALGLETSGHENGNGDSTNFIG